MLSCIQEWDTEMCQEFLLNTTSTETCSYIYLQLNYKYFKHVSKTSYPHCTKILTHQHLAQQLYTSAVSNTLPNTFEKSNRRYEMDDGGGKDYPCKWMKRVIADGRFVISGY